MKKILYFLPVLVLSLLFSSCLKSDLDDLPAFEDAEIKDVNFEYRWMNNSGDYDQLEVIQLKTDVVINADDYTIECEVNVPAATDVFSEDIRNDVTLKNIVGFVDISAAATIKPLDGTPVLGKIADFSGSEMKYKVTAADGSSNVWILIITNFNK